MRRRRKMEGSKGSPPWMTTFSDMITLILVFFILLFSMSQIDITKFKAVVESYNERTLHFYPSVVPMENPSQSSVVSKVDGTEDVDEISKQQNNVEHNQSNDGSEIDQLDELLKEINEYLSQNGLLDVISANRNERGVVLVLQEKVLFETADAAILPSAHPFLNKVGELLENIPNPVKVEGHTDNRPISTARFPSNWELSAARAGSVIRFLESRHALEPKRFTAVGYGDTRPIVANDGPSGWQKNRRVEIVITDPAYVEKESNDIFPELVE